MGRLRGDVVTLHECYQAGADAFGVPIFSEVQVQVENVLIGHPTAEEITEATLTSGKKLVCMLGIPKGDTHRWENSRVDWTDASGQLHRFRTFGVPIMGVEANVPGAWHKKVRCEAYG